MSDDKLSGEYFDSCPLAVLITGELSFELTDVEAVEMLVEGVAVVVSRLPAEVPAAVELSGRPNGGGNSGFGIDSIPTPLLPLKAPK